MDDKKLIDINELSRRLSISKGTLYNFVYQRRIPFLKIGRALRFDLETIDEFLRRQSTAEQAQSARIINRKGF